MGDIAVLIAPHHGEAVVVHVGVGCDGHDAAHAVHGGNPRAAARAADQLLIDVIPAGVDVRGGYLRQLDKLLEAAIAVERTGANLVVRGIDVNIHTQLAAVCGRSIGSVDPVGRSAVVQGDAQITRIIIISIVVINTPHKTLREGEVHAPGRGKACLPQELGVIVKRLAAAALTGIGSFQRAVQQLGKIEEMPRVQQLTVHGLLQRRADGGGGAVPRIQQLVGAAVGQHQRGGTAVHADLAAVHKLLRRLYILIGVGDTLIGHHVDEPHQLGRNLFIALVGLPCRPHGEGRRVCQRALRQVLEGRGLRAAVRPAVRAVGGRALRRGVQVPFAPAPVRAIPPEAPDVAPVVPRERMGTVKEALGDLLRRGSGVLALCPHRCGQQAQRHDQRQQKTDHFLHAYSLSFRVLKCTYILVHRHHKPDEIQKQLAGCIVF